MHCRKDDVSAKIFANFLLRLPAVVRKYPLTETAGTQERDGAEGSSLKLRKKSGSKAAGESAKRLALRFFCFLCFLTLMDL
jgi:hypothetical protein